jgi:hypothetical protein
MVWKRKWYKITLQNIKTIKRDVRKKTLWLLGRNISYSFSQKAILQINSNGKL